MQSLPYFDFFSKALNAILALSCHRTQTPSIHPSVHPSVPQKAPCSLALRGRICSGSIFGTTHPWITLEASRASSCLSVCWERASTAPSQGLSCGFPTAAWSRAKPLQGVLRAVKWTISGRRVLPTGLGRFCREKCSSHTSLTLLAPTHSSRNHLGWYSQSWLWAAQLQKIPVKAHWGEEQAGLCLSCLWAPGEPQSLGPTPRQGAANRDFTGPKDKRTEAGIYGTFLPKTTPQKWKNAFI